MESTFDKIWEEAVEAATDVIDSETTAAGMTETEAGELYLEVADELRMRGHAMIGE